MKKPRYTLRVEVTIRVYDEDPANVTEHGTLTLESDPGERLSLFAIKMRKLFSSLIHEWAKLQPKPRPTKRPTLRSIP